MGTSKSKLTTYDTDKDHPHAYGDKKPTVIRIKRLVGSSPRVWGQGYRSARTGDSSGDHPHAYGDKF